MKQSGPASILRAQPKGRVLPPKNTPQEGKPVRQCTRLSFWVCQPKSKKTAAGSLRWAEYEGAFGAWNLQRPIDLAKGPEGRQPSPHLNELLGE